MATQAIANILRSRRNARLLGRSVRGRRVTPQRYPKAIETSYARYLLGIANATRAIVRERVYSRLPELLERGRRGDQRADAAADDARTILDVVRLSVDQGVTVDRRLEEQIREFGRRTSTYQGSELQRQIRQSLGIEVPLSDPRFGEQLRSWAGENVRLIKTIPDRSLDQVERLVIAGVDRGARWETLRDEIEARFEVSRSRAALIARDQVGKFYGTVQKARQTEVGLTHYFWRTSGDERVRPTHVSLEGKRIAWDDPPEEGHPGHPINCRCTAEPDFEAILEQLDEDDSEE